MTDLQGEVAIVTGAASGIGKATAETFAQTNITGLMLVDINLPGVEKVAEDLQSLYQCEVIVAGIDVSQQNRVNQMVNDTVDRFGKVDILVNNAGICPTTSWDDTTLENWNRILEVNLTSAYVGTMAVLPHMKRRKYGRIVNISSAGAILGSVVAHPAYGTTKAGMIAMTKSAAKEFAPHGILVNAIAPGSIDTPMTDSFGPEIKQQFAKVAPLKRQGTPHELADAVLFLVSSSATYITGATLHVNGGSLLV